MSDRDPWVRSLYWRIALACLGLLAAGLAVQLGFVVATLSRPTGLHARITAQQLAETIARDLSGSLEVDPATDVPQVLARYLDTPLPAFFVTPSGRVRGPDGVIVPDDEARLVAEAAEMPGDGGPRPVGIARVEVLGELEGRVVVLPRRPGLAVLRDLG